MTKEKKRFEKAMRSSLTIDTEAAKHNPGAAPEPNALEIALAEAMWEAEKGGSRWNDLWENEKREWCVFARAAIRYITDEIVLKEYTYWRDAECDSGVQIGAVGACANICGALSSVQTLPRDSCLPESKTEEPI